MEIKKLESILTRKLNTQTEMRKLTEFSGLCRNIDHLEVMEYDYVETISDKRVPAWFTPLVFSVLLMLNEKYLIRLKGTAFARSEEEIENIMFTEFLLLGAEI